MRIIYAQMAKILYFLLLHHPILKIGSGGGGGRGKRPVEKVEECQLERKSQ